MIFIYLNKSLEPHVFTNQIFNFFGDSVAVDSLSNSNEIIHPKENLSQLYVNKYYTKHVY